MKMARPIRRKSKSGRSNGQLCNVSKTIKVPPGEKKTSFKRKTTWRGPEEDGANYTNHNFLHPIQAGLSLKGKRDLI